MRILLSILVLCLHVVWVADVAALPVNFATTVGTFYRDCATTSCETTAQPLTHANLAESFSSGSMLLNDSFGGLGEASVSVRPGGSNTLFAPVLRAEARSEAPGGATPQGSTVSAVGGMVQRFDNRTAAPIQVRLQLDADWVVKSFVPPTDPNSFVRGASIGVRIFENGTGSVNIADPADTSVLGIAGFLSYIDILQLSGQAQTQGNTIYFLQNSFSTSETLQLMSPLFTLDPGKSFFFAARLALSVSQGGEIDAFNTVRTSFVDANGRTYAAGGALSTVPVSEPGVGLLLLLAGAWVARRRRALTR